MGHDDLGDNTLASGRDDVVALAADASRSHGGPWPLRCNFESVGAESPLSPLQLARSRLAPRASGWLDPAVDPDSVPSAEMRACGELRVSCLRR